MTDPDAPVLRVSALEKTFRIGFFRKKVPAVRGVDFEVSEGEIFGLLGPNGAGKTTIIKMILGLIFPDRGDIRIFGAPPGDRAAVRRVGYMPENPYIYQYLKPTEFLDLCGRVMGMPAAERGRRIDEMIERVGLGHARGRPIGKFSKGMMQRVGLAQALLHDPELLILDEPMSGLDPIGRREIRELLVEQKQRGKTLVFTSHILSDVELLCDRVFILERGKLRAEGLMRDLLHRDARRYEIELTHASGELIADLGGRPGVQESEARGGMFRLLVDGEDAVQPIVRDALAAGAHVIAVGHSRETLEDFFVRSTDGDAGPAPEADASAGSHP